MTPNLIKNEYPLSGSVEAKTHDLPNAPDINAARPQDQRARESAAMRGAAEGRKAGKAAGIADGYKETYTDAKAAAFNATVKELYQRGEFKRQRTYFIIAMVSAFILGFGLQYGLLYLLRKKEVFFDIDRIVLSKHSTTVDLTDIANPPSDGVVQALKGPEISPPRSSGVK